MSSPFDQLASRYSALWSDAPEGRSQREEVWRAIDPLFRPGDRILDLGCGTGDDALHLMARGVEVRGIDAAPAMVERARARGADAHCLSISNAGDLVAGTSFHGALSNFGAFNCLTNLSGVAADLTRLIEPGGYFALCLMGRFSWRETARFLLRFDLRRAVRRWTGRATWRGMEIRYWSARELRLAFAPQFTLERRVAVGAGDHQLYVFRRTGGWALARAGLQPRQPPIEMSAGGEAEASRGLKPTLQNLSARHQFLKDYSAIRAAEGRGSVDSDYYRGLPFNGGHDAAQWRMRARTFRYFVRHILPPHPCRILDLGAGNGWLSYRLAELGHAPVAVDIFADARDGLRAIHHYPLRFPVVEAQFDQLPLPSGRFDLAVYNASLHYSSDYHNTLREALRCLAPGGKIVILDSPVYRRREDGERMRAERQRLFEQQFGFRSEALGSIEFFDLEMLDGLARDLALTWKFHKPWYGLSWHLRPLRARWKNQRQPSRFWIMIGERTDRALGPVPPPDPREPMAEGAVRCARVIGERTGRALGPVPPPDPREPMAEGAVRCARVIGEPR